MQIGFIAFENWWVVSRVLSLERKQAANASIHSVSSINPLKDLMQCIPTFTFFFFFLFLRGEEGGKSRETNLNLFRIFFYTLECNNNSEWFFFDDDDILFFIDRSRYRGKLFWTEQRGCFESGFRRWFRDLEIRRLWRAYAVSVMKELHSRFSSLH